MRVVVLGGGACGMTAAWELAASGVEVTVLEREGQVGGLCATHERDGWRFDLGGHRFISRSGALVDKVRGLLGEELLTRTRSSAILLGGRCYRYPLDPVDLARQLPITEVLRSLGSWLAARWRAAPGGASFESWVETRFGRHLYDLFFGPYTAKLWGLPPSQLSADWAAERISLLDLGDALLRLLALRSAGRPRSYARRYYYPRLGIGQIFDSMAGELRRLGGDLRLGAEVVGIERDRAGNARAVRYRDARGERVVACDAVLSTLSLPLLARWIAPADDAVAGHAARLRYRAVRFLNVCIERPAVTPHTWLYVSEPQYLATRIQEPRHRSPAMAPAGSTSLMFEIPCEVGGEVWRAGDDALRDRVLDDVRRLGLPDVGPDVRGCFSTFVTEGYPVYTLDYREHQRALLETVARVPNLLSCGRQGTFRYVFMDIAMEMGLHAARQILDGAVRQRDFLTFRTDHRLVETQSVTA